ncbi:MAG: hypothetical protein R3284_00595 [Rubricoccaceae bacterium]|nr:hypothetical protein [Rubricoccaceae bacterium]
MRITLLSLVSLISLTFAISGCDTAETAGVTLVGVYEGDYTSFANGAQGTIAVTLPTVADESAFTWTALGEFEVNGTTSPFSLSGTGVYIYPEMSLTIIGTNSVPNRTLTGTVSADGRSFRVTQNEVLIGSSTFEEIDVSRTGN